MSSQPNTLLSTDLPLVQPLPEVQEQPVEALSLEKSAVPAKERYVYLDAMKGIMILWGIPVHACVISDSVFFKDVAMVSGWVRMEAFFIISGFLSYMLVKRYGNKTIFLRRLVAVGIPLTAVLLLLNPINNFLALDYHNGAAAPSLAEFFSAQIPQGMKGTWNWHLHVWFLIVLLIFATFTGQVITAVDKVMQWCRPALRRYHDEFLLILLCGALSICTLTARIVYEEGIKDFISPSVHYVFRSAGYYLSFYALGMAMFASPRLMRIITSFHWVQFAISAVLLWASMHYQDKLPNIVGEILRLMAETYAAVLFATVIFGTFKRFFSTEGKVMKFVVDSAFCVYLFHYLVIYLNAYWLRTFITDDFTLSLLVTLFTIGMTMLIYEFGVRRSTWLRFLFLGKIPKRKA